jgi:hypothetical protein
MYVPFDDIQRLDAVGDANVELGGPTGRARGARRARRTTIPEEYP